MEQLIDWINNNLALVAILVSAVAAIGAIYPLLKDLTPRLLRFAWELIRMSFIFIWWLLTPIRKPLGIVLAWPLDRLFDWIESRERKNETIEVGEDN